MQIFELDGGYNVQINPIAYNLLPFGEIWDRDKSKTKSTAKKELAYVYFNNDYKSDFFNEPDSQKRTEEVIRYVFGKNSKWEPDEKVQQAEEFYRERQKTFSLKLLEDTMYGIDKLSQYFKEINFNEVEYSEGGQVRPKYDIKKFADTVEKVPKIIESLKKIRENVEKEQEAESVLRGGREKGMYAD